MNKKIVLTFVTALCSLSSVAQLNDGFYRIKNVVTKRYVSMQDNKGHVYAQQTDVDAAALRTITDYNKILSDPGSVIYLHGVGNNSYDISAQGTSLHQMINYYIKLTKQANGSYYAWQENSGMRLYLSDIDDGEPEAYVYARDKTTRAWSFLPVSVRSENYLGIKPTVTAKGKYYASFYCGFAFSPTSEGLHVYYVTKIDAARGLAVYKEIDAIVPKNAPVFVECTSQNIADNRVDLTTAAGSLLSPSNLLRGVYFNINDSFFTGHVNRTAYDSKTMRVLGVCADGSLGYVTSSTLDYLPANTSYMVVPESAPKELKLVTEQEYIATGISSINIESSDSQSVYDLRGVKVLEAGEDNAMLPSGVYIRGGKKFLQR